MAYAFGTIRPQSVPDFLGVCEKRGWVVVKHSDTEIRYLDRNMNSHTIRIDAEATEDTLFAA